MSDFSRILLATDLDGTFFGKQARLVERNLVAVERFKAAGGRFTIATGRVHYNIVTSITDPRHLLNAPAVFSNGAYLYDVEADLAYSETLLPEADARALLAFAKTEFPTIQFRVSARTEMRAEELTRYIACDARSSDQGCLLISPCDTWPTDDWYKVVFRGEPEELAPMRRALLARFGKRFDYASSGVRSIEVMEGSVSKAAGLRKLRAHYAEKGEPLFVISCGDFENDLKMLQEADLAICPQNACDEAKRVAHAVLCHHDEGLIGDLIERLERGELTALAARTRGCDA